MPSPFGALSALTPLSADRSSNEKRRKDALTMVDYLAHFESTLAPLKDERRYRVFAAVWQELGLPLGAKHERRHERAETIVAGG